MHTSISGFDSEQDLSTKVEYNVIVFDNDLCNGETNGISNQLENTYIVRILGQHLEDKAYIRILQYMF